MKIYTKTGDAGETGLVGSNRVSKSSATIEAIGSVDELNSLVGVIRSETLDEDLEFSFHQIQNDLFDLGALLASTPEQQQKYSIQPLREQRVVDLEQQIDRLQETIPPIREFILPAGNRAAALIHLARSVCRRVERTIVYLHENGDLDISPIIFRYINRLSDWLFVAARCVNHRSGHAETVWKKPSP